MFFIKFSIFVIVTVIPVLVTEGKMGFRITNGILAAEPKEFPYVASLEKNNKWVCGAVLINSKVALTTGMCARNLSPNFLTIRVGTFIREDKQGENVQVRKVAKIVMHPNYQAEGFHDNDISLLYLEEEFQLNEYVNIINLATQEQISKSALIMGWGKDAKFSDNRNLMTAPVFIISNEYCEKAYEGRETITDSMACVISVHNQVVCRDSGSPVVIHYPENPKKDILVGLASHSEILKIYQVPIQGGPPKLISETCDTKKPSVLTRITAIRSWILNNVKTQ